MLTALLLLSALAPADCSHLPPPTGARAAPNDNRTPAGTLRDGALTLRLVAREVAWRPDGPSGCALRVRAFAEEGKRPRVPGPLVRVRAGTEVRVTVRNALPDTLWLRGLHDRASGTLDSAAVAPGVSRAFRFRATTPGAWYYSGGAATARVPASNTDGQLVGALVVDSAAPRADRVFVMTRWSARGVPGADGFQVNAINGLSWPHTERIAHTVGDTVRWHVINASDELHMMHLHGFYFHVDRRGDAAHDSATAGGGRHDAVTTATRRGEWISITWSPERPGNWLFHCHLVAHMSADQRLDRMPGTHATPAAARHDGNHANDAMAGLLLGIAVRPAARVPNDSAVPRPRRTVRLFAGARPRVFADHPGYGFVIQDGALAPARDSIRIPGAPLLLARGEPAEIVVHNRLAFPLGVHWHGLELESYYDGVGGFSGSGRHIAPMIAPGDSFVVRLTPPRAGTFMYHIHSERGEELASGLYAPLLVLEPGAAWEARTDHAFVIADGGPGAGRPTFVNGTATPDTLRLVVGERHRFRLIDIAANDAHQTTLRGPDGLVSWRAVARDGRDLPREHAAMLPARTNTAPGVTQDYEFTPAVPGDYALAVAGIVNGRPTGKVTTVPIRVTR